MEALLRQAKLVARAEPILARVPVDRPATLIEVGVFKAQLAAYLLERRHQLRWIGVDHWLSAESQPEAYRATGDTHANAPAHKAAFWKAAAYERIAAFGERAKIMEMASAAAASLIADRSIDLIFVDADHSREGCLADCHAWWPKVKPGGWLAGHDYVEYLGFGVIPAVDEFEAGIGMPIVKDGGTTWWLRKP
jgi:hypothetical protein